MAVADLEAKHIVLNKGNGDPTARQAAVDRAQANCDSCRATYEGVSDELQLSIYHFKNQKTIDLKEILINWVNLQVSALFFNRAIYA